MAEPVKTTAIPPRSIRRRQAVAFGMCALLQFGVAMLFPRSATAANDNVACAMRIIHALPGGNTFDPQLDPLKAQLTQPPLSAWKTFRLLEKKDLTLHTLSPVSFAVPGEHQGRLEFLGTVEGHDQKRLRLRWLILDGTAKLMSTVFVINNGGTVLQAGIKHEGGLLVLGLTCKLGS